MTTLTMNDETVTPATVALSEADIDRITSEYLQRISGPFRMPYETEILSGAAPTPATKEVNP